MLSTPVTPLDQLGKTWFLVALASGLRSSQLQAFYGTRSGSSPLLLVVKFVCPFKLFMAMIERLDHTLHMFPTWMVFGALHPTLSCG